MSAQPAPLYAPGCSVPGDLCPCQSRRLTVPYLGMDGYLRDYREVEPGVWVGVVKLPDEGEKTA
jgi:hypothetical protein